MDLGQSSTRLVHTLAGHWSGLVASWLALVGPTLGWTLASLAQNWYPPLLVTGRPLVESWLALVGFTLGWTLASLAQGWYNP